MLEAACGQEQRGKQTHTHTLTCEWGETKGKINPLPCCMAVQLSDLALDSVKPFEMMSHQKATGEKDIQWLSGEWPRCHFE